MPEGSVTVVVPTRNRPQSLRHCLDALKKVEHPHEVLVIDNGSDTAETREVAASFGVRCVVEPTVGVNRARNRGMREATTDIVVYIDDDTIATRDWLPMMVAEFADPRVMAVGGRIIAEAADEAAAHISGYDVGEERQVVDRDSDQWFERANFGGLGNGANMGFRRSGVAQWGGFDERIGYGTPVRGFGDHNAFFRVVHAGFRAVYTPKAVVFHPIDATFEEVRAKRLQSAQAWGAYVALLAAEYPEHRRRLIRYAADALRGKRRAWRAAPAGFAPAARVSRWQSMLAAAQGLLLYARIRRL